MAGAKRKSTKGAASQVAKKTKGVSGGITTLSDEEINSIASQINEQRSYNSIVQLLDELKSLKSILSKKENDKVEGTSRLLTLTIFKCFNKLYEDNLLVAKKSYDEKKTLVVKWLLDKYESFKAILLDWLSTADFSYETSIQLDMLDIYMSLIKLEATHMSSDQAYFPTQTYKKLIQNLLKVNTFPLEIDGTSSNFILEEFNTKYFSKYWDLQFYFYYVLQEEEEQQQQDAEEGEEERDVEVEQKKGTQSTVFGNFYRLALTCPKLLFDIEDQKSSPNWSTPNSLPSIAYKSSAFKTAFQKTIMNILSLPSIQTNQYKSILLVLHKRIIPYMAQPQNLMDFLTDCYNITDDEVVPILALNSLYELMKRYNLEYPEFYTKLYSLLTPNLLYTRYRSRFFRLCDLFLSSTHLSSNLVASFIKKLARLSLRASASGVVIVIPFIYNLLKRHPSCMVMIHRPSELDAASSSSKKSYTDTFNNDETDPLRTGAIDSSLWELETLMSHYHPNIATLAKIFAEPFRKLTYNMEDFLDWSYITLLDSEKTRRYRGLAALEYQQWDKVLGDEGNTYISGWKF
ncbi:nucleolar complex protein 4 [[Candida] railenensis]|uniref:Nucleolar complex protein 4 n=1 Tax=[Candida] railenensis TaxID=45579 RepID=A0A9P0VY97_9ASCO|nr:nucleolar complex protein 4 [[Candida] railenensis]